MFYSDKDPPNKPALENAAFSRRVEFLARMIEKYGDEILPDETPNTNFSREQYLDEAAKQRL